MPDMKIEINILRAILRIISKAALNETVLRSILGISWFWFLGVVFLAQFSSCSKDVGSSKEVAALFL